MSYNTLNSGRNSRYEQISRLSPEQQQMMQQMMGGISGGMGGSLDFLTKLAGGDPEQFAKMEAPAMRQFEQLQGDTASRFSGMGMGGRKSSGFSNEMGGAAADLSERLQSNRMGMQQQAIKDLMGMGQNLLGIQTFDTMRKPKEQTGMGNLLNALIQGLGAAGGMGGGGGVMKLLNFLMGMGGKQSQGGGEQSQGGGEQ